MTFNPFSVVTEFEEAVKEFTGAPYAVALDSGTSALELSLLWQYKIWDDALLERMSQHGRKGKLLVPPPIEIPKHTFISVPTAAIQAGYQIRFHSREWKGWYRLDPLPIWDSATRFRKGMWGELRQERVNTPSAWGDNSGPAFICLSFQYRKHLPIGRGGMILHNNPDADAWFRKARFFGREECQLKDDEGPTMLGWRKYMTPDEAARGLCFLHRFEDDHDGSDLGMTYPDLSGIPAFKLHVVE